MMRTHHPRTDAAYTWTHGRLCKSRHCVKPDRRADLYERLRWRHRGAWNNILRVGRIVGGCEGCLPERPVYEPERRAFVVEVLVIRFRTGPHRGWATLGGKGGC
jgi:hypothetical protein